MAANMDRNATLCLIAIVSSPEFDKKKTRRQKQYGKTLQGNGMKGVHIKEEKKYIKNGEIWKENIGRTLNIKRKQQKKI